MKEANGNTMENVTMSGRLVMPDSLILVIFGGSGDLTSRKLMPSLYQLFRKGMMPERFAIVGVARTEFSDESYREKILSKMEQFLAKDEFDPSKAKDFVAHLRYIAIDPADASHYEKLKKYLEEVDKEIDNPNNYIFYLATPPELYGVIPQHLQSVALNEGEAKGKENIRRIVIEKPFGYNLQSAKELNRIYNEAFQEEQLYRIDHYLGKETAQNILALRFANGIFEPLWNRNYIDRVEITAVENLGIETRGGYYDQSGALRDMVQNHLVQLLALVAMEPPTAFNSDGFRNEVVKVYQAFEPLTPEEIRTNVVRGQYLSSQIKDEKILKAYREEDKVDPNSRTETFVAMKLFVNNWRWSGVPFYIRTGKQMPTKVSEIVVHFKHAPHCIFGNCQGQSVSNILTIRISPNEGTALKFGMKMPGSGFDVKQVSMDFTYEKLGGVPTEDAYSRLLYDCMLGDATLFTRSDAVEASWSYFDPVIKAWESDDDIPLYGYPARAWGPRESDLLLDEDRNWTNPCKNLTDTDLYCEL